MEFRPLSGVVCPRCGGTWFCPGADREWSCMSCGEACEVDRRGQVRWLTGQAVSPPARASSTGGQRGIPHAGWGKERTEGLPPAGRRGGTASAV